MTHAIIMPTTYQCKRHDSIKSNLLFIRDFFLEGLFVCICKSQADQMHVFAFLFSKHEICMEQKFVYEIYHFPEYLKADGQLNKSIL